MAKIPERRKWKNVYNNFHAHLVYASQVDVKPQLHIGSCRALGSKSDPFKNRLRRIYSRKTRDYEQSNSCRHAVIRHPKNLAASCKKKESVTVELQQ